MRVAFGEYQLDTETRTLQREGRRIPVQSKAFDLLAYLIERRARVVSSNELLDALWPGLHVTPAALSTAVQKARQAVGDDGEHQAVLQTEHGQGFRFVAEVTDLSELETAGPGSAGAVQVPFIAELKRRNVFRVAAAYGIVAWLLMEVASVVLPALHLPGWTLTFLITVILAGFPLAVILAWAFELTPEGIKRETAVDPAESITHLTGRKIDFAIIGLLAFAVVFLVVDHYIFEAKVVPAVEPVARGKSIAVLPFVNMSADPDQEYFADGISEELLNTLVRFEDLRVVGRTSSFSFKNSGADLKTIGEKLGVSVIVEGSVRTLGDRVRITAQLVDAKNGFHRWSETYDRELTDIFAIQTEIATAIADALRVNLSPQERERLATPPTENLEAYQAYLLGTQRLAKLSTLALAEAVDYFQRAIELDPGFALAYVGLADSYVKQPWTSGLPKEETLAKAQAAADKALKLDDRLGEAYTSIALIKLDRNDSEGAKAAYQRALELNPNYAPAYFEYGNLLRDYLGRSEEALALHLKGVELDPLWAALNEAVGIDFETLGQFDESLAWYKRAVEVDPGHVYGFLGISAHYYYVEGQLDEAVVWYLKCISLAPSSPNYPAWLGTLFLDLGDPGRAEYWINRSIELGPQQFSSNTAMRWLHLYRGDEAAALESGRKAFAIYPHEWPVLALLRDHELSAGRYPEARALYEEFFPELLNEDDRKFDGENYESAIDLALVLSKTGEQERADLLLNRSLQHIQTLPRLGFWGYWISDVRIYTLQGDIQKALSALQRAVDEGWRSYWWYYLKHDPNLELLHDEPEFQAIVAEIEADMAEQLARVREMERNGELTAIPRDETNLH